jgi:hypothetical protein
VDWNETHLFDLAAHNFSFESTRLQNDATIDEAGCSIASFATHLLKKERPK